jgi:polysaccharide export outer membrane protein
MLRSTRVETGTDMIGATRIGLPRARAATAGLSILLLLGAGALGGCADNPFGPGGLFGGPAPPPPAAKAMPTDEYVIGPGDQLGIFVYDSPQLSSDVPVRPDGRISTPLIQTITAAGKTPTVLGHEMEDRLKEFIKDPRVTIIVRGFVGPLDRQIRVIGEAADPLALPYREHLTVLDVMIASKGLTRYAAGNRAVIVRRGQDKDGHDKQETIRVRLSDLMKDGDISQNVELQPGDTLIIPQSWF